MTHTPSPGSPISPVVADRLETVLLAKLAGSGKLAPGAAALAKLTRRYAPTTLTEPQWREQVEATLADLHISAGSAGAELERRLGPHTATKWEHWKDRLLPALALGIRPDDEKALRRLSQLDGWVSAIAARALDLWPDGPPLFRSLCDAVVWRALGIDGAPETCPPALRAHFLRRHIEIAERSPSKLVRQIAARAVESPSAELGAIRDSLVRVWLAGREPRAQAVSNALAPIADAAAPAAPDLVPSLVEAARDVAHHARDGAFGERKVFISSVWQALRAQPAWAALALDDFKAQLVAAHRGQQLELARADLVSAMDPALVAASETRTDGATFHFIVREPNR